jgi:histidinol-phosphate aminotransferase
MDRITRLVDECAGLVVVDEAYVEFSNRPSLASLACETERLAVIRTFSKAWGLAGARVGYLVAHPSLIGFMHLVGLPYPLSRPSARAAVLALEREGDMCSWREQIITERERVRGRLENLGIHVLPSEANFHLFFLAAPSQVQRTLAERFGVLVRDRSSLPGLEGALRVTIGSPQENDAFLAALETLMASFASDGNKR